MRLKNIALFLILASLLSACYSGSKSPYDYADPMIGTDGLGHTFPGATVPFGMVQLSPSNDFKAWNWCSGYHYSDSILKGFAHTHLSGAGLAGLGDILFMPTTGEVKLEAGTEENPEMGYRSRFSHNQEEASPGYYSVVLKDYDVNVELTATERVGFHKYTPAQAGTLNVIIDPTHHIMERVLDTGIEYISDTEMRGYKKSDGEGGERTVFFYARFSKPIIKFGLAKDNTVSPGAETLKGKNTKAFVQVQLKSNEALQVQVALSFVSHRGAKSNFDAEGAGLSFTEVHTMARSKWSEKLNKIKVDGKSTSDKRIFYTAMYHSFISPNLISDVNGKYVVEGKVLTSEIPQYSNFSTWDTFRALNPLFTMIDQEKTAEFVNSLASRHSDAKVGLPVWECLGHDNVCMIGYNAVSPLVDAALKDIKGIDANQVYEAVRAAAMSTEKHSPNYDKNGMEEYIQLGFVPAELNCAVSKTTEQNYYDWCIAMLAKKLGRTADAQLFIERSLGYRNLFNPQTQFLHSKYTTGEWREMDLTVWSDLIGNYVSGNIWAYSAFVPHDVEGLMSLIGGREELATWLDGIFTDTSHIAGDTHVDISGFIGKYGHGDEPGHHMPYLYNYAGQPWKTQSYVRKVMDDFYQDTPDGLVNNDDLGQMSAWYIFGALGFYPVCPGDMQYIITAPLFSSAAIQLENGKQFTIRAKNNPKENIYIQSVTLNGEPYTKSFIAHQQIMQGGEMVFEMGGEPNKKWASEPEDMPVSSVSVPKGSSALPQITLKPFDKDNSEMFEGSRKVRLHSNTPDADIYYTLDGSTPDKKSKKYKGGITMHKTSNLKAIAYADGMKPSFVYDRTYYAGRRFEELAQGYPILTLENKAGQHIPTKDSPLMNQKIGSEKFNDGRWVGFNGRDMVAVIDFGQEIRLKNLSLGFLSNTGVWIFPPSAISVSASNDNKNFKEIAHKSFSYSQAELEETFLERPIFNLNHIKTRYLKVTASEFGPIPSWHAATGHKGLMYLDEIILN
ncbi:alpha-1,2-mannosidase, putative [Saccharicrinis carchari]|uniref:Alpha-1,2-mannosidase, putative n=1 Tax=Saccharicrinis carchari TaxID=1168039 RepID=A0A521CZT1_SACCC|nr:GH92 family glycosyl hydrolase [Saccharicrinis carchari]SMO64261.1 alpha-1,2-mannosidase, putative [Saccharicrinis carchari]